MLAFGDASSQPVLVLYLLFPGVLLFDHFTQRKEVVAEHDYKMVMHLNILRRIIGMTAQTLLWDKRDREGGKERCDANGRIFFSCNHEVFGCIICRLILRRFSMSIYWRFSYRWSNNDCSGRRQVKISFSQAFRRSRLPHSLPLPTFLYSCSTSFLPLPPHSYFEQGKNYPLIHFPCRAFFFVIYFESAAVALTEKWEVKERGECFQLFNRIPFTNLLLLAVICKLDSIWRKIKRNIYNIEEIISFILKASKKKGLSMDEKRTRLLQLFYESKEFFQVFLHLKKFFFLILHNQNYKIWCNFDRNFKRSFEDIYLYYS